MSRRRNQNRATLSDSISLFNFKKLFDRLQLLPSSPTGKNLSVNINKPLSGKMHSDSASQKAAEKTVTFGANARDQHILH